MIRRSRFLDGTFLTSGMSRPRSLIRSIQRGTISLAATSGTATITAVVVANSIINYLGNSSNTTTGNAERAASRVDLTNSTTVTAFKSDATDTSTVGFEVIEFYPGVIKSIQRGTITLTTVSTNTATITTVTTTRATLSFLGFSLDGTAAGSLRPDNMYLKLILTNATTVTADRGNNGGTAIIGYQVVEFY